MEEALLHFQAPMPWLLMIVGTALGIIVGAVPGLTGAMLIAMTLPLTHEMDTLNALVLLVSMYVGSVSGGLITATLLRMPGTPASVMTTLDGYPMAQAGKPGRALGLGISASLVGGLISWIFLFTCARWIADKSILLGPFDMFALVLMALVLIVSVSGSSLVKGAFSGVLGMFVAMPGLSPSTGSPRMTFGWTAMNEGFGLLPVLIGLFAISQVLTDILKIDQHAEAVPVKRQGIMLSLSDWRRQTINLFRSSLIGTWVGMLPGIGANIGSVMAYTATKNLSSDPEEFGHGSEDGIVASEAANNATVGGALIPLVAMGIPGSVIDVILLGALIMHGLQPGPFLYTQNPEVVQTIVLTVLLSNIFMFVFMVAGVTWLARLMYVRRAYLLPAVLVFCVVGCFALSNRFFDVWIMLAFGGVGFVLERLKIPLAPFVIGLVLAPIAERELNKGLMLSNGSFAPLVQRPVALVFVVVSVALLIWPLWRRWRSYKSANPEVRE